ncbi:MAG TPA: hypothetical protein VMW46_10355 [Candidatus Desulfaltia sp.]|nr:hypothetical protein [Candidatus Desulfaltia sp.]
MKRFMFMALLLAAALSLQAQEMKVEIRKMTEGFTGNQRFPAVAENVKGERIYTFRGNDLYSHYYYYKNGTWSGGGRIPGSPRYGNYWFSDIVADSTGTFHYVCEDASKALYYGFFKDGTWASMRKIDIRHEATLALGVRSDDTVVLVSAMVAVGGGITKDVIVGTKPAGKTIFSNFQNITGDRNANTMVDAAIDADDNTWISYKMEFPGDGKDILDTILHGVNKSGKDIYWKNVSDQTGWTWYSRVAINSDGKIMVTWMRSQHRAYFSCLFDPLTKKWTEFQEISDGPLRPWCTMYNKLLARESDFYWVGLTGDRMVVLYKYDAEHNSWIKLADVSDRAAYWCSAHMGSDSILITWDNQAEPTSCYLTTVSGIFPPPLPKVQSVSNLVVVKRIERSFFHGYSLNILSWEDNPLNAEQGITIAAHRVYRKERTADSSQWALISALAADVYSLEDKSIASDIDYVYAVTCVDSNGDESPIVDPSEEPSETTRLPGSRWSSVRSDR